MDELAAGNNFDNEGRNGGWVLPLLEPTMRGSSFVTGLMGPYWRYVSAPRTAVNEPANATESCHYNLVEGLRGEYHVYAIEPRPQEEGV